MSMKTMCIRATNRAIGLKLMAQTRSMRRHWIIEDKPSVAEVIGTFPLLRDPIIVSKTTKVWLIF